MKKEAKQAAENSADARNPPYGLGFVPAVWRRDNADVGLSASCMEIIVSMPVIFPERSSALLGIFLF